MTEVFVEANFSLAAKPTPACYWKKIWKGLNTMRQTWQFCDVVLTSSDNKLFTAHTAVLVASSSTFLAYFSGSEVKTCSNGSSKFNVFLPETPSDVLQVVLDFIYGITPATPIEILKLCVGSKYFGMDDAYAFCMKYFQTAKKTHLIENASDLSISEVSDQFKIGSQVSFSANSDKNFLRNQFINPPVQELRVQPSIPSNEADPIRFNNGFGGILSPDVTDSDSNDGRMDGLTELDLTDLTQASECPHLRKLRNQSKADMELSSVNNYDELSEIVPKSFCFNELDSFVDQSHTMSGGSNDGNEFVGFMMDDSYTENSLNNNAECRTSPGKGNQEIHSTSSCIEVEAPENNCAAVCVDTNIHANNSELVSQANDGSLDDHALQIFLTNPNNSLKSVTGKPLEDSNLLLSNSSSFQEKISFDEDFVEPSNSSSFQEKISFDEDFVEPSFSSRFKDSGPLGNMESDCSPLTNVMCENSNSSSIEIIPRLYSDEPLPIVNVSKVSAYNWDNDLRQEATPSKSQRKVSKFVCQDCGEVFSTSYKIQTHQLKQHNKGKLFSCRHCPFKTPRRKDLQAHSLSQHGEKPPGVKIYTCPSCQYRCIDKNRYEEHEAIHQGIPKYNCPLCNKAYTTRRGMKTHLKYHSDNRPFKCSLCPSDFKVKSKLADHMKLIHLQKGVKPFKCGYCEHYTALRGNCNQHIKKNHPGQPVFVIDTLSSTRKLVKNYDYANLEGSDIDVYHETCSSQFDEKTLS